MTARSSGIRLCAAVACLFAVVPLTTVRGADEDARKAAKQQAEACQKAFVAKEFDKVIAVTTPALVEALGGRDKAIAALKEGIKAIEDKGFTFKGVTIGEPAAPVAVGKVLYTVVPMTMEISTSTGGKLLGKGGLVGVSSDGGKNWTFVDAKPGREAIKKFLPDLPETLTIPKVELVKE